MKRYIIIMNNFPVDKYMKRCFTISGALRYSYKVLRKTQPSLESWIDIIDSTTGEVMISMNR